MIAEPAFWDLLSSLLVKGAFKPAPRVIFAPPSDGKQEGTEEGMDEGTEEGMDDDTEDGAEDGMGDGNEDGIGDEDGTEDGTEEGMGDGAEDGMGDGERDGARAAERFSDVTADAYYAPAVSWMLDHEITTGCGMPADMFCPLRGFHAKSSRCFCGEPPANPPPRCPAQRSSKTSQPGVSQTRPSAGPPKPGQ